ncbi:MAG: bifunctional phosphopantothenoylcysteine decarboxylase/phosphopantothenate--cysteine ligase CoaBC [Acidobacteria bacterium ACB1]|nr:Coenzyme A biosynthesis bifunctional protein CoaBC [Pyrinomonadaceae bacterium]MCE7961104.1 bifunctional phosphopantothenoylcysteine decarboxylase/phosphopantothenate--cysteine ligase CoaBC [Acidobacteria bacterium ACB1]RIJ89735.1 MAG: bifunctional phosphopantothenoylcysteine decarboxylase/phosphopantothenate--cysteine ligase CoaBC [Acidobacteriota bacterium]
MANYRVGLGVSGGIAAYKAVEVMRALQKAGCDVSVAMTRHATEFVQPLTFRALTDKHVIVDDYDPENPDPIAHVNFSQQIDLLLVVPATANIIGKFANGVADDFLSSTYLATTAPVLVAPAMNTTMWEQPATQRNIARLKADGVKFVEPISGELACKTVGTGKLEDVENIVAQALAVLGSSTRAEDLAGERFLITVGGTREAIDPVRFISNHSSGKMGFAMAAAASARGAKVTVVAGMTTAEAPANVEVVRAISAAEMHKAVMERLAGATVFVGAAAVADYAPANAADAKIKKDGRDTLTLELKKTPDILGEVSASRPDGMIVVGFAAETNDVIDFARAKLEKKKLDIVVANDVSKAGAGFNTDTNIISVLTDTKTENFPLMSKREAADRVCDAIKAEREARNGK